VNSYDFAPFPFFPAQPPDSAAPRRRRVFPQTGNRNFFPILNSYDKISINRAKMAKGLA
jgi:hypothetical protein